MQLEPGQIIQGLRGRFQIRRRCGEGGFGLTFEAVDEQGRAVAVKQLKFERLRDWKALELFEREGRVLAQLQHPSIPAYVEFFAHDGQRAFPPSEAASQAQGTVSWFLVQQFVQGPTLQQIVDGHGRLREGQLVEIMRSLLATLDYLHTLHPPVIHRDINPKNIVLADGQRPFLVDFGAIQDRLRFEDQQGSTSVGTLGYMPLEQLRGAARPSSDLYALGMTVLAVAAGRAPSELPVDEATGKVDLALVASQLPAPVRRVLDRMIEPIAGQRIASAAEALAMLSAPEPRSPPMVVTPRPAPVAPRSSTLVVTMALGALVTMVGGGLVSFLMMRAPAIKPVPIPTVATAIKATPVRPPVTVAAVVPPTPGKPFSLTWKARVVTSVGTKLTPGAACEVRAMGNLLPDKFDQLRLVAQCGSETLFDSEAQLNGTSMLSWDLRENPVAGKDKVFSYPLSFSDVGTRVGARAQATIDTQARQAVLFRETIPVYRVVLSVDPNSANRAGEPLLTGSPKPLFDDDDHLVVERDQPSVGAPQLAVFADVAVAGGGRGGAMEERGVQREAGCIARKIEREGERGDGARGRHGDGAGEPPGVGERGQVSRVAALAGGARLDPPGGRHALGAREREGTHRAVLEVAREDRGEGRVVRQRLDLARRRERGRAEMLPA